MKILLKIFLWLVGIVFTLWLVGVGFAAYINQKYSISPVQNKLSHQDSSLNSIIFKFLQNKMRDNARVAIAISHNDTIEYIGIRRQDDALINEDLADSLFQIGSVSKVVTTSILSQMINEGSISSEATIDEYLGYPLHNNLKIKIKNLANHTSGLDRMPEGVLKNMMLHPENPYITYTNDWMEEYLKKRIKIDKKKETKPEYSNLGISILGYVLSKRKNTSYEDLVKTYIFDKLKMRESFVNDHQSNFKIIKAYDKKGKAAPVWTLNSFAPAGGIVSNLRNMILFAEAQIDSNYNEMHLSHMPTVKMSEKSSFGLGWIIKKTKENKDVLFHNGATGTEGGYTSSVAIDKDSKKAVVILSTIHYTDAQDELDKLAIKLLHKED